MRRSSGHKSGVIARSQGWGFLKWHNCAGLEMEPADHSGPRTAPGAGLQHNPSSDGYTRCGL